MESKVMSNWGRVKLLAGVSVLALSVVTSSSAVAQKMPSQKQMWEVMQRQHAEIKMLKRRTGGDDIKSGSADTSDESGLLDSMMGGNNGWWNKTSIGGYGELHVNTGKTDQVDFHRYVLFVNHEFNNWIKLNSELELEHSIAGEGQKGEVELEQAYIHFSIKEDRFGSISNVVDHVDLGLQLIPVGILNANHEPPTFYGVERNEVEKRIIPTTWWEAGALIGGKLGNTGIFWDAMLHSGLDTSGKAGDIRGGRQKVAKATADNPAYTMRLGWAGNGISVAGSYQHQSDITPGDSVTTKAKLLEIHADIKQPLTQNIELGFRTLYAQWDVDGAAAKASGRNELNGYYFEPSIKFDMNTMGKIGLFYRYEAWDRKAGDSTNSEEKRQTVGVNYWPEDNVVLKIDYRKDDHYDESKNDSRIDFGIGYQF